MLHQPSYRGLKIIKRIDSNKDKILSLISRRFLGVDSNNFKIKILKKKIKIEIPDEVFFGENIQIAKRGLALDILKYFDQQEVEFIEIIKRT